MIKVATLTSRQLSRNGPTVWGDEWMSQRGKDPLGFQLEPRRELSDFLQSILVTSQPFLLLPMKVIQSISTVECHTIYQSTHIFYIYALIFKIDKSLLGRAGDSHHIHWWHGNNGVLGTGCVSVQPGGSQRLSK